MDTVTADPTTSTSSPRGRFGTLPARARAAGIHLSLSGVVFLVALYLILVQWYPGFHFTADGGWQGVRIMAAVDLVLGPMLTLIIFNPFKSRRAIVFDLACIGIAQVGALAWGFYAIQSQHPVAVTYLDGTFRSITVEPLKIEKYDPDRLAAFSDRHPPLIYVRAAQNSDEEARKGLQELVGGVAEHEDPFFFTAFAGHWPEVRARGRSLEQQRKAVGKHGAAALDAFVAGRADAPVLLYYDYKGRYASCTAAFTADGALADVFACEDI